MSLFNEIQRPGINGVLHKWLGMKDGAPAPQLASDLSAGITIADSLPEWDYLAGVFRCSQHLSRGADAGNFSVVALFNGQTSGVLGIIEKTIIRNNTAAAVVYELRMGFTTGLGNSLRGMPHDQRWGTKQSGLQLGNAIEAAATGQVLGRVDVPANSDLILDMPIILAPAGTISGLNPNFGVVGIAINVSIQAMFIWREAPFDPTELR